MIKPVYLDHELIYLPNNVINRCYICKQCKINFFWDKTLKKWLVRFRNDRHYHGMNCAEIQVYKVLNE